MRAVWWRRAGLRVVSILAVSAVIAAIISFLGTIRDLGSFHASLLTGFSGRSLLQPRFAACAACKS